MDKAISLLKNRNILFVTGAGMSTDSGIPDYRGKGMLSKNPLIVSKYISDQTYRRKFWITAGREWFQWLYCEPNPGHDAIALMEHEGNVVGVITQNVDGLHEQAGSLNVAEIHGNMFTSSCLLCNKKYEQDDVIAKLRDNNPRLGNGRVFVKTFLEPMCDACGGFLKPDVVFFGDFLPEDQWALGESMAKEADAVVIAGTSLNVGTPYHFIDIVREKKGPVIIVNKGRTLMDDNADVKISAGLSEVLPTLAGAL